MKPATFVGLTLALGPVAVLAQQPRVTIHHIDVVVTDGGGAFQILAPCSEQKIDDARRGQKVEWHVHNKTRSDIALGAANFGRHPEKTCTNKPRHKTVHLTEKLDPEPLQFDSATSTVTVKSGTDGYLRAVIKRNTLKPRTYKYELFVNGKPVLDPEIEIEK